MNKKGTYGVSDLLPLALIMVATIIGVAIGADVVDNVQADQITNTAGCNSTVQSACSTSYNISTSGLEGLQEYGSWFDTIALVIVASVIIGILVYSFAMRK